MSLLFSLLVPMLFDWKVLKSEHYTVMYKDRETWEAQRVLKQSEIYRPVIDSIVPNTTLNLPIVIEDAGMYTNGYADPFMKHIHLYTYTPNSRTALEGLENWLRSVSLHENVHGAHLTYTRGVTRILQHTFGSAFNANMYAPGWFIEGIAVYAESQISPYEGRLNDGFYSDYMHVRQQYGNIPSLVDITNLPLRYPYDTHYLYGSEFFDFLAARYGQERFSKLFRTYGSYIWAPISVFVPMLGIDAAARCTYGHTFPYLFDQWRIAVLGEKVRWYNASERLTHDAWYIFSATDCNSRIIYVQSSSAKIDAFNSFTRYAIMIYDPETDVRSILCYLPAPVTAPIRCYDQKLFYTTRELRPGLANITFDGFGITATLHRLDLRTGTHHRLFTDEIRTFCVFDQDSILYSKDREDCYGSELWLWTPAEYHLIYTTDFLVQELLWTGSYIIATCKPEYGNPDIYVFSADDLTFMQLTHTPWTEAFISRIDTATIGYTSNNDNTHALYEMDLTSNAVSHVQVQGYARSSVYLMQYPEKVYFIGLHARGHDLYCRNRACTPYESSLSDTHICESDTTILLLSGTYGDILETLLPAVRMPLFIPKDSDLSSWLLGGLLMGEDAVQENTYYLYAAYDNEYDEPYFRLQWDNRTLTPVQTRFFYENDNLSYVCALPLYSHLDMGLNNVALFLSGRSFDRFSRKEIVPGISIGFRYPFTRIACTMTLPYERRSWQSSIDRSAQFLHVSMQQVVMTGALQFSCTGYLDRDNPDSLDIILRGQDAITSLEGISACLIYSHKLFAVRWGLWNPNMYFEDVFISLFCDYAMPNFDDHTYSIGLELSNEIKLGFGYIKLVPCTGVALTHTRDVKWYFTVHAPSSLPYFN